jgi:hypothetical protein
VVGGHPLRWRYLAARARSLVAVVGRVRDPFWQTAIVDRAHFVVIVEPAPLAIADARFAEWCAPRGWTRESLGDDVLIDTGRGADGDWRRYSVRRSLLQGEHV